MKTIDFFHDEEDQPLLSNRVVSNEDDISFQQDDEDGFWLCLPKDWILAPKPGKQLAIHNTPVDTLMLLLNSMIGSGIIVQPYVFYQSGIFSAIFQYIIVGFMTYFGIEVLISCSEYKKKFGFDDLCTSAFGPYGKYISGCTIVVFNLGTLLSYVMVIGSLIQSVVSTYVPDSSYWYLNETFLTFVCVGVFVVPICLIRNFSNLALISYLSIIAISGTMMLVLFDGPIEAPNYSNEPLNYFSLSGSFRSIGSIIFAFCYTTATFHAYRGLYPRTEKVFSQVTMLTTIIGVIMCFITGFVGYLCFRDDTEAIILENFTGNLGAFFKVLVVVHLVLFIPGDYVILRSSLVNMFDADVSVLRNEDYFLVTLITFGGITALACYLLAFYSANSALSLVLDLTGGVTGSLVAFILPGCIGIFTNPNHFEIYSKGLALIIFGVVVAFVVVISSIVTFFSS